ALIEHLRFSSTSDDPTIHDTVNTRALTVTLDDGGNFGTSGAAGHQTASLAGTITITSVNDAPTATVPGAQTVAEDTALSLANTISIVDPDDGGAVMKASLAAPNGTLTLGTVTGLTFASGKGNGTADVSFTGTKTDIANALKTLSYQGAANFNGTDTITLTVDDQGNTGTGGAQTVTKTIGVTISAVNDAPVFVDASLALTPVKQGTTGGGITGDTVGNIVSDGSITEVPYDNAAVEALAIVGKDSSPGTWYYKIGGGAWTQLGAVSDTNALLLGSADSLKFVPTSANWTGSAALTVRAWDQTDGKTAGSYVSTSGSTAYSTSTASLTSDFINPSLTPFSESFGTTPSGWVFNGAASVTGGELKLTNAGNTWSSGGAFYNTAFSSSLGVHATFDYYAGGGLGAEGLTFILVDGAVGNPTSGGIRTLCTERPLGYGAVPAVTGPFGATLAQGVSGASRGYLGVGFDDWNDTIRLMGQGNGTSGYGTVGSEVNVGNVDGGWRKVDVATDASGRVTMKMSWDGGLTWTQVLTDVSVGGSLPSTFKFGFGAVNDVFGNTHSIDNLKVENDFWVGTQTALHFDGTQQASVAHQARLAPTAAATVEAWVRTSTSGAQAIVSKVGGGDGFNLRMDATGHLVFDVSSGGTTSSVTAGTINDGTWHHIAGIYNGSVLTAMVDSTAATSTIGAGKLGAGTVALQLGGDGTNPGFAGDMADLRLWNVARTTTDVTRDMTHEVAGTETGLVGSWRLDEGSGTTLADSSITGAGGTAAASQTWVGQDDFSIERGQSFSGLIRAFDATADAVTYSVATGPSHGTLTLNGDAWTYQGTESVASNDSFTINATMGSTTLTKTIQAHVLAVNHAPILDTTKTPVLTEVNSLSPSTSGDVVGTLVNGSITEQAYDNAAVNAIAVTGVDNSHGTWEYSVGGGAWTAVGTVSDTGALLLDATDKLRFTPNGGWYGESLLTFRAWDKTDGNAAGAKVTTVGSTAFSTASDTMQASSTWHATEAFAATPATWTLGGSGSIGVTGGNLVLTSAVNGQTGFAFLNTPVSTANGIHATFKYYAGGGTGADSTVLALIDGTATTPTSINGGAAGGYTYAGTTPGLPKAYMGIAFDEFGNFGTSDWGGSNLSGGAASGWSGAYSMAPLADSVVMRGSATVTNSNNANAEYDYIAKSVVETAAWGGIDGGWRNVDFTLTPDEHVTLRMSWDGGVTWRTIYDNFDFGAANRANSAGYSLPSTLKLGFTSSTGADNDAHYVDDVVITDSNLSVKLAAAADGDVTTLTATVRDLGPVGDHAAKFVYSAPTGFTVTGWKYTTTSGKTGSGSGNISQVVDLSAGDVATFTITGQVASGYRASTLTHTAAVTPTIAEVDAADNTATLAVAPQITSYSDTFSSTPANWTFTGPAAVSGGVIQLNGAGVINSQGGAFFDTALSTAHGLHIAFDVTQTTTGSPNDGVGLLFYDGSTTTHTLGAGGGDMGYMPFKASNVPGLSSAFLGIAFDVWGGFATSGAQGTFTPPTGLGTVQPNHIGLRGGGNGYQGYDYLTSWDAAGIGGLLGTRRVDLTIDDSAGHHYLTLKVSTDQGSTWSTVFNKYDLDAANIGYSIPGTLKFAFSGQTGNSGDLHNIDNLTVEQGFAVGRQNALHLDGAHSATVTNVAALHPTDKVTVEAWLKIGSAVAYGTVFDAFDYAGNGAPQNGYKLMTDSTGTHAWLDVCSGGVNNTVVGTTNIADGKWHNIAASYDGSTMRLYVDGTLDGTTSVSNGLGAGSNSPLIGTDSYYPSRTFNGDIADLNVWHEARTATQVQQDMSHQVSGNETNLVAAFRLDEASGTTLVDATGRTGATATAGTTRTSLDDVSVLHGQAYKGMVLGFDAGSADTLTYALHDDGVHANGGAQYGTVAFDVGKNTYTYTAGATAHDDSFTVDVSDGHTTISHTITVHVT
ncbi:MAG: LamG-like jellyroll fold domain-containing protein, partial [Actinomycetota bacterium]